MLGWIQTAYSAVAVAVAVDRMERQFQMHLQWKVDYQIRSVLVELAHRNQFLVELVELVERQRQIRQ